jgi:hypothetical protein
MLKPELWIHLSHQKKRIYQNSEAKEKSRKQVICKNTGETFINTTEVGSRYDLTAHQVWEACRYKRSIWVKMEKLSFEFL